MWLNASLITEFWVTCQSCWFLSPLNKIAYFWNCGPCWRWLNKDHGVGRMSSVNLTKVTMAYPKDPQRSPDGSTRSRTPSHASLCNGKVVVSVGRDLEMEELTEADSPVARQFSCVGRESFKGGQRQKLISMCCSLYWRHRLDLFSDTHQKIGTITYLNVCLYGHKYVWNMWTQWLTMHLLQAVEFLPSISLAVNELIFIHCTSQVPSKIQARGAMFAGL